jgi:hypothetical protein
MNTCSIPRHSIYTKKKAQSRETKNDTKTVESDLSGQMR